MRDEENSRAGGGGGGGGGTYPSPLRQSSPGRLRPWLCWERARGGKQAAAECPPSVAVAQSRREEAKKRYENEAVLCATQRFGRQPHTLDGGGTVR